MDRNRKIVEYIFLKWVSHVDNNSEFADKHNINEKTIRRIKEDITSNTSLETIEKLCEGHNMNLSQFFKEVEDMFPEVKIKK